MCEEKFCTIAYIWGTQIFSFHFWELKDLYLFETVLRFLMYST